MHDFSRFADWNFSDFQSLKYASVEAVTLAETIVTQINTMRNTVLTLMNGAQQMHAVVVNRIPAWMISTSPETL